MRKAFIITTIGATLIVSGAMLNRASAETIPTTPCAYEDSSNCYWDAATRGNGTGQSFWADADGNVHYVGAK